jgi:hypothetical protein
MVIWSNPTLRINEHNQSQTIVVKSKFNIRNNRTIGIKSDINNLTSKIKVYPNPASSIINAYISKTLNVTETKNEIATITFENMLGQVVYTSEIKYQKSEINIPAFKPGVYFKYKQKI